MTPRALLPCLILLVPLAGLGCSKSSTSQASSESSSDSSASSSRSSESSSGSSSPSSRNAVYRRDVRDYTRQWILAGGEVESFRRGLAPIARENGITDWERDQPTFEAIGRGVKKSGVTGERFEMLRQELAGPDPKSLEWLDKGYKSESAN